MTEEEMSAPVWTPDKRYKLLIGTPLDGRAETATVVYRYHEEMTKLYRDPFIALVPGRISLPCDIVRARSRIMRLFLESDHELLLYWDRDNAPQDAARQIRWMIGAIHTSHEPGFEGKPVEMVGCAYPKKHTDWRKVADAAAKGVTDPQELENVSQTYVMYSDKPVMSEGGLAEVDGVGFGFVLMTRKCAQAMTDHYKDLTFMDRHPDTGEMSPTCAAFMPMILPNGMLLSEDYAFCERWRGIGGTVHLICVPIDHVGGHLYRGNVTGLLT